MKYEIIITKIEEVTTTKNGPWTVIAEIPWSAEALQKQSMYQTPEAFIATNPLCEVKGYAPAVQAIETVRTEVLKQTIDDIDLASVIKAVNKL